MGVQANINLIVKSQIVEPQTTLSERNAPRIDAVSLEELQYVMLRLTLRSEQKQTRLCDCI